MIKSTLRTSSIVIALLGIAACSHDSRPAEHSGAPGASVSGRALSSVVDDIADARCELEQRCDNIGAGQTYDNRNTCETKLRSSITDDLNTKDCPNGVEHAKLSACLSQIRSEKCGSPMDSLSRWAACRQGELCIND
jgi:hypothetical protein